MTLHSNLVIFKFLSVPLYLRTLFLYIPIWLYSNEWHIKGDCLGVLALHSNLVIFKSCLPLFQLEQESTLHSNLVIFKSFSFQFFCRTTHPLHSNLVIFKLVNREDKEDIILIFTFQSGYIQMKFRKLLIKILATLHSNLVIFKFYSLMLILLTLDPFTFQSGYIQILQQV